MNTNTVIFDIKCVSMGLPPLSMGVFSAYTMIKKMSPPEKRKILRKVRKIAKIEISRRASMQTSISRKATVRSRMERSANLCKDKAVHEKKYVLNRLRLVVDYINYMTRDL